MCITSLFDLVNLLILIVFVIFFLAIFVIFFHIVYKGFYWATVLNGQCRWDPPVWPSKFYIFLLIKLFIFARDIKKMKISSNFININEYNIDFIDISGYIHMTCTLAQSHRLAWRLEPTETNLRASGVPWVERPKMPYMVIIQ